MDTRQKPSLLISLGLLITLTAQPVAAKKQGTLRVCQNTQESIDYYTSLRRGGGSHKRMESWKQSRDKHKETFDELNCKKWRKKL